MGMQGIGDCRPVPRVRNLHRFPVATDWKWRSVMADGELVTAVLAGEREPFALLVERYQRDMYNLAYRSTGQRQDAEDIVQETFLRAYRGLSSYDTNRPLRTWLYAIAVNVCRDWARRIERRPRTTALLEGDGGDERKADEGNG